MVEKDKITYVPFKIYLSSLLFNWQLGLHSTYPDILDNLDAAFQFLHELLFHYDASLALTNTLYGSLLSLKNSLTNQSDIQDQWTKIGKAAFDQEQQQKTAVILKLDEKPSLEIRSHIRSHSLKWNHLRNEWYGYVLDLQDLKDGLGNLKYELEVLKE